MLGEGYATTADVDAVLDALGQTRPGDDGLAYAISYARGRLAKAENLSRYMDHAKQVGLRANDGVVDLGCGVGQWGIAAASLGAQLVVGVDVAEPFVAVARAIAEAVGFGESVQFRVGDCCATGLASESFDLAVSHGVLLMIDEEQGLREASRLLRPGGHLYCASTAFGGRLNSASKYLQLDRPAKARSQLAMVLETAVSQLGVRRTKWATSRAVGRDEMCDLASVYGFEVESRPGIQEWPGQFLGMEHTYDFVARKTRRYDTVLDGLAAECGGARQRAVEAVRGLLRRGAAVAALDLVARLGLADEADLVAHAATRAGRIEEFASQCDAARSPFVRAVMACDKGRYAEAAALLDPLAPESRDARFLRAYCLAGDERLAEAYALFRNNWARDRCLRDLIGSAMAGLLWKGCSQAASDLVEGLQELTVARGEG
jgi:SAM-dependent methyltransferase